MSQSRDVDILPFAIFSLVEPSENNFKGFSLAFIQDLRFRYLKDKQDIVQKSLIHLAMTSIV